MQKAAECYVKANMINKAVKIYEELRLFETAGNICAEAAQAERAAAFYTKAAEAELGLNNHVKASVIYRNKLSDVPSAEQTLLNGWFADKDAVNCLYHYFIATDDKLRQNKMIEFHEQQITKKTNPLFLNVIKKVYTKGEAVKPEMRDLIFRIIIDSYEDDPYILKELKFLNPDDRKLVADVLHYHNLRLKKKRLGT
ncbi:MAG: hypothetical protein EOP48_27395 [Sphingobacteriales bacterium]|nr:MAG: hypothetical protein EOP48_27395 [Sphingobacteriales bacterium]